MADGIMGIPIGVQISLGLDGSGNATTDPAQMVWYKLSDHNRNPISISYDLVQQQQRMANGTMRQYVVARKFKITTDWKDFPTLDSNLVDYNPSLGDVPRNAKAAAWIKAFYEINAFYPVWLKLIFAQENIFSGSTPIAAGNVPVTSSYTDAATTPSSTYDGVYNAFMTTFTYDINKRRQGYDYVNLKIEFTEI